MKTIRAVVIKTEESVVTFDVDDDDFPDDPDERRMLLEEAAIDYASDAWGGEFAYHDAHVIDVEES